MKVLVVDIGGTNVKFLASSQGTVRKFPSGTILTPDNMVAQVKEMTKDWAYDVVAVGYPGLVHQGQITKEPQNLAQGWVSFDFKAAFGRPVKLINDAAMQALGSYEQGTMLFLGLGTGLGSAMVIEGVVVPLELGRLPYKKATFEDYLGKRGFAQLGKKKWRAYVDECVGILTKALELDDIVLGGGQIKKLKQLPAGCRAGSNSNAFVGGFRLWEEDS